MRAWDALRSNALIPDSLLAPDSFHGASLVTSILVEAVRTACLCLITSDLLLQLLGDEAYGMDAGIIAFPPDLGC